MKLQALRVKRAHWEDFGMLNELRNSHLLRMLDDQIRKECKKIDDVRGLWYFYSGTSLHHYYYSLGSFIKRIEQEAKELRQQIGPEPRLFKFIRKSDDETILAGGCFCGYETDKIESKIIVPDMVLLAWGNEKEILRDEKKFFAAFNYGPFLVWEDECDLISEFWSACELKETLNNCNTGEF